jgi:HAD superfamily hydrolase (TIGR01549 family)
MTLTLLLDLDDTLLGNRMETFIPAYIQALTARLSEHAEPIEISHSLLMATRLMIENNRPDLTLMEVFDSAFYPALGLEKEDLQPTIDIFYAEDFPKLRHLTQYRPAAVELVNQALERGFHVGIATNPLFPRTAIEQRLAWAGLPVEDYKLALIPSYDTFHFAKPNPVYYAEFLGQMGWPEEQVIMVGDDPEKDVMAARQAGLPVYWVVSGEDNRWNSSDEGPPNGSLEVFFDWFDSQASGMLKPVLNTPAAMVAVLRSTPAVLENLCANPPIDAWKLRPEPDEWCTTEILCHLRDVEVEVNLPRIEKMLQEVNPFIPGRDTDPWAVERDYIQQDGPSALDDFKAYRQKLLYVLDHLDAESWQRPARHAFFGPTNMSELVDILAGHDRLHIRQIQHTFTKVSELRTFKEDKHSDLPYHL